MERSSRALTAGLAVCVALLAIRGETCLGEEAESDSLRQRCRYSDAPEFFEGDLEAKAWPDAGGLLFWPFACVAGLGPFEPGDHLGDAVQVVLVTNSGDAALVRVEGLEEGGPARLHAYSVGQDEMEEPTEINAYWGRPLNSVEAVAVRRVLDRFGFWETRGRGRMSMTCDGVRVAHAVDGAECFIHVTCGGDSLLVEARVGDRHHYADWNGIFDDNLREIGEFVLSLAGIERSLWGWESSLESQRWTPESAADWTLDELGIGPPKDDPEADSEPPPES